MLIKHKTTIITLAFHPAAMHLLPDTANTLVKNNPYLQATAEPLRSEVIVPLVQ